MPVGAMATLRGERMYDFLQKLISASLVIIGIIIDNLPKADNYTVEVTAYDFYDNPSLNKLTSTTNKVDKTINEQIV